MRDQTQLRPNHYPKGPYRNSPCIHCQLMLKHTGATSGTTWIPVDTPPDGRPRDWWTCWSHEIERSTYGQHEPWEAISVKLPCCNDIEQRDLTAQRCGGTMTANWPEYVCDTCHGRCGAQVHPGHKEHLWATRLTS